MNNFNFNKKERLCLTNSISELFNKGNYLKNNTFTIVWRLNNPDSDSNCKLAISVPKKKFRKAVDRNLIKRRIKEAYRINKNDFYNYLINNNVKINLMLIYTHVQILKFSEIQEKIILTLNRLIKEIEKMQNSVKK
ncbi:MAG: ribonuclease P protein component [Bacteroidota bacterium]